MKNMILFDLDGTLWDTADATYDIVNNYLKDNGYSFRVEKDVIVNNMGFEFDVCAERYFPKLSKKDALELLTKIYDYEEVLLKDGLVIGKIFPNVYETIKKLAEKYTICIVSNCSSKAYIKSFIDTAGVGDYITDSIAASNYFISKAEAIRKMRDRYQAKKIAYIGDTLKDQVSAVDAGGVFVYAKYGFGEDLVSKYSINDISELIGLTSYIFEE